MLSIHRRANPKQLVNPKSRNRIKSFEIDEIGFLKPSEGFRIERPFNCFYFGGLREPPTVEYYTTYGGILHHLRWNTTKE
jgi:hypothetical protein